MIELTGRDGEIAAPAAALPAVLPVLPLRDSVTYPDTLTATLSLLDGSRAQSFTFRRR